MISIIQRINANCVGTYLLYSLRYYLILYIMHLYLVRFFQSKSKDIISIVICCCPLVLNMSNCQAERRECTVCSYILIHPI